ncbi:MAG: phosphatidylserine/phosphatidylglycerophosphate/cardiolipin synthase family protein [SAR324 cluster bacterium]|nr:phosphatidylserine/phosphatidylglycerophosphate/cardiolipin synthase family protein [SAR324 cluster bacterium]
MESAEQYAKPVTGIMETFFPKSNDFREVFQLRWGRIYFDVFWGKNLNIKVLIKVYRSECDGFFERFLVDTEPYEEGEWDFHKRMTRDFYVHPFSDKHGRATCVKFSYIVHIDGRSIPSYHEYIYMDWNQLENGDFQHRHITEDWATVNTYRTHELNAGELQNDVNWYNHDFGSLHVNPKFTKGQPSHPFHPKRFIHDHIDKMIWKKQTDPHGFYSIKVSVDCIDDMDFTRHLIDAHNAGVCVQCIVDWRKMTLTHSDSYAGLKRSGIELLGVFCTPQHHKIEVAPDMHTKFIIFGDEDCILGSFNITFDRWWANWESGMTFHSHGVVRLLDNIFQSIRGGCIQSYYINPMSHFNIFYTFGAHMTLGGNFYFPHQAIVSEIHRARHSIRLCLFLIGELEGEHHDSVIDALIHAQHRGVSVHVMLNGHLARVGGPGMEISMHDELRRPLLPAAQRLRDAGINVSLVYGQDDHPVPYSPVHSKYCVIDDYIVIEGSFNWYNTSIYSHDLVVLAANYELAQAYVHEFYQILRLFRVY